MPERWVLNASPIIALASVGSEKLLVSLADRVVVPRVVVTEILAGPKDNAYRLISAAQFEIVDSPLPAPELLTWDLGKGETAVISFAMAEPGWIAILDDGVARKCARSFSIRIKGTLAIVIIAKRRGLIGSAADLLRALRASGFRLDDRVVRETLKQSVGEAWDG
jgi:predicted nucleic acid-binding protein